MQVPSCKSQDDDLTIEHYIVSTHPKRSRLAPTGDAAAKKRVGVPPFACNNLTTA